MALCSSQRLHSVDGDPFLINPYGTRLLSDGDNIDSCIASESTYKANIVQYGQNGSPSKPNFIPCKFQ